MKRLFCIGLLFFVAVSGLFPETIRFQRISNSEGALSGLVLSIFQDSRGFIWLGTDTGGLIRYDVHSFRSYTFDPYSEFSISNNSVHAIAEDRKGDLWVGTNGGLNYFDIHRERFTVVKNEWIPGETGIGALIEDRKGNLWVGTHGEGLFLLDPAARSFKKRYFTGAGPGERIVDDHILGLMSDKRGRIWGGTKNGFFIIDGDGKVAANYSDVEGKIIREALFSIFDIKEAGDGTVWLATNQGLIRFEKQPHIIDFKSLRSRNDDPAPGFFNSSSLALEKGGGIWLATVQGLIRFFPGTSDYVWYHPDQQDEHSLDGRPITRVLLDREENLWIGTGSPDKLRVYNPGLATFGHVSVKSAERDIHFINTFEEAEGGDIFIGTDNGLLRWSRTGFKDIQADFNLNSEKIHHHHTKALARSILHPNLIWVGSVNGIRTFDTLSGEQTGQFPELEDQMKRKVIFCLLEDRAGNLWIGTYREGLYRYNLRTGKFHTFGIDPDDPASVSNNYIMALTEDPKGNIWIATAGEGLDCYIKSRKTFVRYRYMRGREGLSSNHVLCLLADETCLWAGTGGGGLNKVDYNSRQCTTYMKSEGLSNNFVYFLVKDLSGKIWAGTNYGLSCFDPILETFRNYYKYNGLQDNEFNHNAASVTRKGEVLAGGLNGFNLFSPGSLQTHQNISELYFTDFELFHQKIPPDKRRDSLCQSILFCRKIRLNHRENYLTFRFSALNYSSPTGVNYSYFMDGLSERWVNLGGRNEVVLPFLKPGKYRLRIRADSGAPGTPPVFRAVDIEIVPPLWQTWWFRLLMGLILAIAAFCFWRRRKKKALRRLRTEEAARKYFARAGLSNRETEIVFMILKGYSNKDLEDKLFLAYGTIKNHVYSIYKKLNVKNRAELVDIFKNLKQEEET